MNILKSIEENGKMQFIVEPQISAGQRKLKNEPPSQCILILQGVMQHN